MSKNNFTFDASDLIPEVHKIENFAGTDKTVTFREFSKTNLESYITEVQEASYLEKDDDGNVIRDEDGNPKRSPFSEASKKSYDMIMKYLAVAAEEDYADEEFFRSLELSPKAVGRLVELINHLNHIQEILMSGGNYSVLPWVRDAVLESENQGQTSQA